LARALSGGACPGAELALGTRTGSQPGVE
jgi:hypothetical protein